MSKTRLSAHAVIRQQTAERITTMRIAMYLVHWDQYHESLKAKVRGDV